MFRIQIFYFRKNFFPLGYIDSLKFVIKTCSVGPIIGEFLEKANINYLILQQINTDSVASPLL